jgi:uncharacterized protein with PQ loop repeat
MAVAEVFGWLGGTAGTALLWPQVWRLWVARKHAGLSLTANVIGVLYTCGWLYYGINLHSLSMIATNITALTAMLLVFAGQLTLARPRARQWLPVLLGGLALLTLLAIIFGPVVVGSVVGLGAMTSVGTQVVSLIRQQRAGDFDSSGVSRPRYWLGLYCNSMWAIYGILLLDPVMYVPTVVNGSLSIAVLALTNPGAAPVAQPEA